MAGVYQKKVHEENLKRVIRFIHRHGTTNRIAIAQGLNLSLSAVTNLVTELRDNGLVYEEGFGQSVGGRRPVLLNFNKEWGWVIAVRIGARRVHVGLANLNGELKAKKVELLRSHDPQEVVHQVCDLTSALLNERTPRRIIGMGVCCPGIIDPQSGYVMKAVNLEWEDVPLRAMLTTRFPWPVFVDNSLDTGALGEKWFGVGKDAQDLLYVNVGNGVGVGIISHGELLEGYQHAAGEFGHTSIDLAGPPCPCGNRGCVELYVSAKAVIKKAQDYMEQGGKTYIGKLLEPSSGELTCEVIDQAAYLGDAFALRLWRETGAILGRAIANLVNLLDPEIVVIGGGLSLAHPVFLESVAAVIWETTTSLHRRKVEVRRAFFGRDSGLVGAAALTVERIFA
ncbi:MAG: ROK family transcriptional regulator [Candidatus Caldatribacteriaceae bacterium]